jgi:dTDP-4-amino-4,6-dideoxygalactose transaminase
VTGFDAADIARLRGAGTRVGAAMADLMAHYLRRQGEVFGLDVAPMHDVCAIVPYLDESLLEQLITSRTKAIVPVHYAGVGCEMDAIMELAKRHEIAVVEDNAHGLFGKYKGRWLGTFGEMATQSFHETKNITCGEGGALLINDPSFAERAEIIREKGTNRARFFRGQVDKYSGVDIGSSYVMSDILAAFLYGQLEQWQNIQAKRRSIWERYDRELSAWAEARDIRRPLIPRHCEQAFHMYYLLMPSLDMRTLFIEHLAKHGIKAVFHYLPLHLSSFALVSILLTLNVLCVVDTVHDRHLGFVHCAHHLRDKEVRRGMLLIF